MERVNCDVKKAAKAIAQELYRQDGKNGQINADIWNNKFKVKEKFGREINVSISLFRAEKSIEAYLQRVSKNNGQSTQDLYAKWMDELSDKSVKEKSNKTAKTPESAESVQEDVLTLDMNVPEITVIPKSNTKPEQAEIKIQESLISLGKIEPIVAVPVSTNVVSVLSTEIPERKIKEIVEAFRNSLHPELNEYVQLAKMTANSSLLPSNEVIHEDILNEAFNNVIKDLMQKGKKTKSVLIDTAKSFYTAAKNQSVDLFMLMGISMIESTYGTSKMAISQNNVGGLSPNGINGMNCQSVSDSINIAAKTLHRNVYDKRLDTIQSVGMRGNYCCANSSGRAQWVKNVTFFANKVKNEYNRLLLEKQSA